MGLSLTDIAPQSKEVAGVDVYGVSAEGVASLLPRFPEIKQLMNGQALTAEQLIEKAPFAIAAIIAAGCGKPGDELAERVAGMFPLEIQLNFLEAIGELTFTDGFGPFVKRLEKLVDRSFAKVGKAPAMKSPAPSKPLSETASLPGSSGL